MYKKTQKKFLLKFCIAGTLQCLERKLSIFLYNTCKTLSVSVCKGDILKNKYTALKTQLTLTCTSLCHPLIKISFIKSFFSILSISNQFLTETLRFKSSSFTTNIKNTNFKNEKCSWPAVTYSCTFTAN
jgi:hypothetical protein